MFYTNGLYWKKKTESRSNQMRGQKKTPENVNFTHQTCQDDFALIQMGAFSHTILEGSQFT